MTDLLLTLALAAHLIMVNLALTGPLYSIWLERRGRKLGDEMPGEVGQKLAKGSWHALLGALVMGVVAALVLHIPGEEWFQELMLMPRGRVHWGAIELLFSLALMVIYANCWKRFSRWPWTHRSIAILATTNLIYHFPTFFVIFSKLRDEGRLLPEVSKAEFKTLLFEGEVMTRSLHYLLASVAMSGLVVMLMALRRTKDDDESAAPQRLAIIAARASLVATLLQLPVGFMVFVKSSGQVRDQLLGGDILAGGLMLGGILSAVMLLHTLSSVAMGEPERGKIRASALWMLLTILLMTGVLVRLREPGPLQEETEEARSRHNVSEVERQVAQREATPQRNERMTRWKWRQSALPRRQPARPLRLHPSWG